MSVAIRSIGTAVPPTVLTQAGIRDIFAAQPALSRLGRRRISAVFDGSGIDTRHTVVSEFGPDIDDDRPGVFYDHTTGALRAPTTGVRNLVYAEQAPGLFVQAADLALSGATGIEPADVTHLVTVSCTGFVAPGPDVAIVRRLGLRPSTERYHLGFMGCYGAFPALRLARSFCSANPDAVVLVVAAELCTIHLQSSEDPDTILSSSVFADGAAAAIVSARPVAPDETVLELDAAATALLPVGESDMTWTIGDHGFDMRLSSAVPRLIEQHIEAALASLLDAAPGVPIAAYADIDGWAIHPGGRSILDRVQRALKLSDDQLESSREVLRRYGNVSSATVLFILQRLLHEGASRDDPDRVAAMAFGPGLTAETALFTRRTG